MNLDSGNIDKLSDDELFKALKDCGLNVGPITSTTRTLYERRLKSYLDQQQQQQPQSSTTESSSAANQESKLNKTSSTESFEEITHSSLSSATADLTSQKQEIRAEKATLAASSLTKSMYTEDTNRNS
jgi:hypothetical protein